MISYSGFDRESFQRLLERAFLIQERIKERRDPVLPHCDQLELIESIGDPPLPETLEEVMNSDETFIPEFRMLPQNQYSLYVRCRFVLLDMLTLTGFRHLTHLVTVLARQAKTVVRRKRESALSPAIALPIAPAMAKEAKLLNSHGNSHDRWRNFASATMAGGFARRTNPTKIATGRMPRLKKLKWSINFSIRWKNIATTTFVSGLAHRAGNLHQYGRRQILALASFASGFARRAKTFGLNNFRWPNLRRMFERSAISPVLWKRMKNIRGPILSRSAARARLVPSLAQRAAQRTSQRISHQSAQPNLQPKSSLRWPDWHPTFPLAGAVSGFAQLARNLNGANLRRYSAPAAVIVVVFAFALQMAQKRLYPVQVVGSSLAPSVASVVPRATPKTIDPRSSAREPFPGKSALATGTASTSPKPFVPAKIGVTAARKKLRMGSNEVQYIGDDVTVRTFTDKPSTRHSTRPDDRIVHIGDDVVVRSFAATRSAEPATR